MLERGPTPEQKITTKETRTFNTLQSYKEALETAGRRVVAILGPALALGSPAFAAENEPVNLSSENEMHCDIAYINENGEHIGSASLTLPNLESLPKENATIPTELRTKGDCSGERIAGLLTEEHEEKNKPKAEESPSLTKKLKETAHTIQKQSYSAGIKNMDSKALGWTFIVDTQKSPTWSAYDVRLTTALTLENSYGINDVMKGKLPERPGAFIKIEVKPRS